MFFVLSKAFWLVAQPMGLATILAVLALLLSFTRFRKSMRLASAALAAILLISCFTTAGLVALNALEDRFARADLPDRIDGIIVLGGAFDGEVSKARSTIELGEAADRFVEAAALSRRFPDADLIVSGGGALLSGPIAGDAEVAPAFFAALGIEPARLILEKQSVNTWDNARFTAALPEVRPSGIYVLVTSAFHMPRSVGCFRTAGLDVLPWPVDYRTSGTESFGIGREDPIRGMIELNVAVREWIGLAAYWMTGKTPALFPAP